MAEASEDNNSSRKLADIATSLRKLIECPVCLEAVAPPARQCSNGHVTCSPCARRLTQCALCKEPILKNKPTFINCLLEALPRFCRHGCTEVCVNGDGHEDFCVLRLISCREPMCNAKVNVCKMKQHYQEKHGGRFFIDKMAIDMVWTNFNVNLDQNHDIPVFYDDNFFYLKKNFSVTEKHVMFTIEGFPQRKLEQEYFMRMRFAKENFEFSKTIKSIIMKNYCDKDGFKTVLGTREDIEDFYMKVSSASLLKIMSKDELLCSLKFFKS